MCTTVGMQVLRIFLAVLLASDFTVGETFDAVTSMALSRVNSGTPDAPRVLERCAKEYMNLLLNGNSSVLVEEAIRKARGGGYGEFKLEW